MHQHTSAAPAVAVAELAEWLRGTVLRAGDAGFPLARRVWNAAVERQPAAVLVCADAEDVALP